jgi:para-nitrobenzyl esterase
VYAYEFAERDASWFPGFPAPRFPVGASHMLELPYLFTVRYLTPATQQGLRATMIDHWARFATTGQPGWPEFHNGQFVLSLAANNIGPTNFAEDHKLAFWRTPER